MCQLSSVIVFLFLGLTGFACATEVQPPILTPTSFIEPTSPPATSTKTHTPTSAIPTSPDGIVTVPRLPIGLPREEGTYDRKHWGGWIDADRDCQNTRAEVLIDESLGPVGFTDGRECVVVSGRWLAPYTGIVIGSAGELDIDHMVPLANAHRSGGWAWTSQEKKNYANSQSFDGHLIAVTASANRSKGARGPETWRPPDANHWCDYAINWIVVKNTWDLTATNDEWNALTEMLETCPGKLVISRDTQ